MVKYDSQEIEYQLHIDSGYYNTLDLEGFSRMMKDPSYCYKFYWLEAIVQLISEDKRETTYNDIINEMIANAWYSVLEFHVHLSGIWGDGDIKDSLEKAVLKLHKLTGLPGNVSKVEIKNKIAEFDKELHGEKITLTQNVPYKLKIYDTSTIHLPRQDSWTTCNSQYNGAKRGNSWIVG